MLPTAETDVAMLGELKLIVAAFGIGCAGFLGLVGLEEEFVVIVEGDGVLGVGNDADVDDGFFEGSVFVYGCICVCICVCGKRKE